MATRSGGGKEPPVPAELQTRMDAVAGQSWSSEDDDGTTSLAAVLAEWKAIANACYTHGCFLAAIRCYTKLIALPSGDTAAIRSNRSAAYLQSPMHAGPSLALKDAEKAVELDPTWFKGHLRVGDAQRLRGNVVEADEAYRKTLALQPGCTGAVAGLKALEALLEYDAPSSAALPTASATLSTTASVPSASPPVTDRFDARGDGSGSKDNAATPLTPEQQLEAWKREACVREDRTGMRPAPVSLAEADRQQGAALKQALLSKFRSKVATDDVLRDTLRERREAEVMRGDGVDYREGEKYRAVYARSTDGIGLGISADAYKDHTGQVNHRTW